MVDAISGGKDLGP